LPWPWPPVVTVADVKVMRFARRPRASCRWPRRRT
jgi:hypothetical protein